MSDQGAFVPIPEMAAKTLLLWIVVLAGGCQPGEGKPTRWYTPAQVEMGRTVFARHCAACHGSHAQGPAGDWQKRRPDGFYPPPPLDGSAHAWHHPLPLLIEIIQKGGALYDGKMPAFGGALSEAEQYAVVAWFQSLWSDDIYRLWSETDGQKIEQGGSP